MFYGLIRATDIAKEISCGQSNSIPHTHSAGLRPAFGIPGPRVRRSDCGSWRHFSFGSGANVDTGVGLRAFNRDRRNSTVGSLGIDYMFASQQFRGTVGLAALRRNAFFGADVGYGFGSGTIDFGPSVGFVRTTRAPAPASAPSVVEASGIDESDLR